MSFGGHIAHAGLTAIGFAELFEGLREAHVPRQFPAGGFLLGSVGVDRRVAQATDFLQRGVAQEDLIEALLVEGEHAIPEG